MYKNIGEKCKGLALVSFILGVITSVIWGIVVLRQASHGDYGTETSLIFRGIAIIVFGSLGSWIGSWALYCIGDTNCVVNGLENYLASKPFALDNPVEGKAEQTRKDSTPIGPWTCICGYKVDKGKNACPVCGRSRESVVRTTSQAARSSAWKCPSCGRENQGYVTTCPCGQAKPQ